MSHAETSLASMYPRILPWLPKSSANSGSGTDDYLVNDLEGCADQHQVRNLLVSLKIMF
jgi:hypothetical protein